MNRNVFLNLAAGLYVFIPTTLLKAEDQSEAATIRLSHGVLRYDQATDETESGTTTTKEESSGFSTFPPGIEIAAFVNGYSVYAYPVNSGASVLFGKAFGGNQEAGLSASLNSYNIKDGNESSYNSIGGYYFYSRPLSDKVIFEFDINPSLIMGKDTTTTGGATPVTEERDANGYSLYLDALGVVALAKNFEYVFGIDYTYTKVDTKVKSGSASSTEKFTGANLGIILAKFRYSI